MFSRLTRYIAYFIHLFILSQLFGGIWGLNTMIINLRVNRYCRNSVCFPWPCCYHTNHLGYYTSSIILLPHANWFHLVIPLLLIVSWLYPNPTNFPTGWMIIILAGGHNKFLFSFSFWKYSSTAGCELLIIVLREFFFVVIFCNMMFDMTYYVANEFIHLLILIHYNWYCLFVLLFMFFARFMLFKSFVA